MALTEPCPSLKTPDQQGKHLDHNSSNKQTATCCRSCHQRMQHDAESNNVLGR
jgi:cytochrome c553